MIRRPPKSTPPDQLRPATTLLRSLTPVWAPAGQAIGALGLQGPRCPGWLGCRSLVRSRPPPAKRHARLSLLRAGADAHAGAPDPGERKRLLRARWPAPASGNGRRGAERSEEHTSELQSLMRISYAVFCLKKKTTITNHNK